MQAAARQMCGRSGVERGARAQRQGALDMGGEVAQVRCRLLRDRCVDVQVWNGGAGAGHCVCRWRWWRRCLAAPVHP